jgi:succinate dehydrogenase / fumarate reductase membrane anchor subunit
MTEEPIVQQVNTGNNLFETSAWFFMRVSGVVLLFIAVFHLMYMYFIIPGGVTAIDYNVIVARWTDPAWGFFWRFFDLLLLTFGLTHGSNGLRNIVNEYVFNRNLRPIIKTVLILIYLLLIATGAIIIFSFQPVS